jgi:hypothetical protein
LRIEARLALAASATARLRQKFCAEFASIDTENAR